MLILFCVLHVRNITTFFLCSYVLFENLLLPASKRDGSYVREFIIRTAERRCVLRLSYFIFWVFADGAEAAQNGGNYSDC